MADQNQQGILPATRILALVEAGAILPERPLDEGQVQPASLDLRLGAVAYRVRASFLPGPGTQVRDRLERHTLHAFSLAEGAVLETGCVQKDVDHLLTTLLSERHPQEPASRRVAIRRKRCLIGGQLRIGGVDARDVTDGR